MTPFHALTMQSACRCASAGTSRAHKSPLSHFCRTYPARTFCANFFARIPSFKKGLYGFFEEVTRLRRTLALNLEGWLRSGFSVAHNEMWRGRLPLSLMAAASRNMSVLLWTNLCSGKGVNGCNWPRLYQLGLEPSPREAWPRLTCSREYGHIGVSQRSWSHRPLQKGRPVV